MLQNSSVRFITSNFKHVKYAEEGLELLRDSNKSWVDNLKRYTTKTSYNSKLSLSYQGEMTSGFKVGPDGREI